MGNNNFFSKVFKGIKNLIIKIIILVCIITLIYSLYNIYIILDGYKRNDDIMSDMQEMYHKQQENSDESNIKPDAETGILGKYNPLLEVNSDVVGWINVPNTRIDYPVLQAEDNEYYLDKSINNEKNSAGSIFMDYRNSKDVSDRHTILYGHHMRNGSMFKDLIKYEDRDFFSENKIIRFDTLYEEIEWEIFSVYLTEASFDYIKVDFNSSEEYLEFINTIKDKSIFKSDIDKGNIEFKEDDQILTLSTCAYDFDDARLVVHAKMVK